MIWHNPTTNPPPRLCDVLLALRGEKFASEGCRVGVDGEGYMLSTGHPVDPSKVYAWTPLPRCPAELEGVHT